MGRSLAVSWVQARQHLLTQAREERDIMEKQLATLTAMHDVLTRVAVLTQYLIVGKNKLAERE